MVERTVGFALYSNDKYRMHVDLKAIYNIFMESKEYCSRIQDEVLNILLYMPKECKVQIRNDGTVFCYKTISEELSFEILKSMWEDILKIINKIELAGHFENVIYISIISENIEEVNKQSMRPIKEFSRAILDTFSLHVTCYDTNTLFMIVPVPKTIPANVVA